MSDTADKTTSLYKSDEVKILRSTKLAQVLWFHDGGTEFFFQDTNAALHDIVFLDGVQIAARTLSTPSVLKGTGLAAVDWSEGDQVRLYCQQADTGALFEQASKKGQWSLQPLPTQLPPALLKTGLAALSWSNGSEIRVYSQNDSKTLQAYVCSKNAWSMDPNLSVTAGKESALAVTGWNNGVQQRLYFQDGNGAICEAVYSNGWHAPTTLLALGRPTALAAVSWGGTSSAFAYVRVYYQGANDVVQDLCYNGGTTWAPGTLKVTNAQAKTSLCAVQSNDGNTIRVTYLIENNGGFGEAVWDGQAWAYHSQTG